VNRDDPVEITNAIKQNLDEKTQLVVVLVTSKRKDRYDAIKRVCCLEMPVPSQVVTTQIVDDEKKRPSVITKVAIQMNCKLGGEIWKVNIPVRITSNRYYKTCSIWSRRKVSSFAHFSSDIGLYY
jgi:aubergine-like protein